METAELRPLSLGELLDRTFSLYRNHFWVFVGIMAIPASFGIPVNLTSRIREAGQLRFPLLAEPPFERRRRVFSLGT